MNHAATTHISDVLAPLLDARGVLAGQANWTALQGGRTNRIWKVSQPDQDLVIKLYTREQTNPLFPNDPTSEAHILKFLEGRYLAPRLLDHFQTDVGYCLAYQYLAGSPWKANTELVADLLLRIHDIRPPTELRLAADGSDALRDQTYRILSECSEDARNRALRLEPEYNVEAYGQMQLLHGDPVASNMIVGKNSLHLIDWQCPALGDPCEDLSLFLSPAMQIAYRGKPLSDAEKSTFLDAYQHRDTVARYHRLAPWYHWRMMAYCMWQEARGDAQAKIAIAAEAAALQAA